jgi:ParB family chromosome partitioning protein
MGNVKYKAASSSLMRMAAPSFGDSTGRKSVGMENSVGEFFYIKLDNLIPFRNQARELFDQEELDLLAESIKNYGVRQPLAVVKSPSREDKFEIVSGERRAKAARIALLDSVPCIILKNYREAEVAAVIENIHRSDLHPVELARAYSSLIENGTFSSVNDLYKTLGVNRTHGYETLRILELPKNIQRILLEKDIRNRNQIRALVKSSDPQEYLRKLLREKAPRNFSVVRITAKDGDFTVQKDAIKKLNSDEKKKLKIVLDEIVSTL